MMPIAKGLLDSHPRRVLLDGRRREQDPGLGVSLRQRAGWSALAPLLRPVLGVCLRPSSALASVPGLRLCLGGKGTTALTTMPTLTRGCSGVPCPASPPPARRGAGAPLPDGQI